MVGGATDKRRHVGVTAHDPIQEHDVGSWKARALTREIHDVPFNALFQSSLTHQRFRVALVGRRELDVARARRACAQKLDLQSADTTADLEYVVALSDHERDE